MIEKLKKFWKALYKYPMMAVAAVVVMWILYFVQGPGVFPVLMILGTTAIVCAIFSLKEE